jgi:hypothetical protein
MSFENRNSVSDAMAYIVGILSKQVGGNDLKEGYELFSKSSYDKAKKLLQERNTIETRTSLSGQVFYKMR